MNYGLVGDNKYYCNCPDFTKKADKNPSGNSLSELIDRNWQLSNAGVEPGRFCKHIWATLILEKRLDEVGIPKDPAIERIPPPHLPKFNDADAHPKKGDYFGF